MNKVYVPQSLHSGCSTSTLVIILPFYLCVISHTRFLGLFKPFSHFFFFLRFFFVFLFLVFLACLCHFFLSCTTFVYTFCFFLFFFFFFSPCFCLVCGILAMFLFVVTMCVSSGFELRACGSCVCSFT